MSYCKAIRVSTYDEQTAELIARHLPEGDFRRIVIKPNWVKHASSPDFPIEALVTDYRLIAAIIEACRHTYPKAAEITVGDAPLQGCDWDLLSRQAGIVQLMEQFGKDSLPRVRFCDFRRDRLQHADGYVKKLERGLSGDPKGYRDVVLDDSSYLDEISDNGKRFRVADYEPKETISNHRHGYHHYTVAGSVLDADLVINVPKMKCHQKAGLTGALKNLVGINGNKANLVHYRLGFARSQGDEFPPDASLPVYAQVRVRKLVRHAPRWIFRPLQWMWRRFRKAYGIEVHGTRQNLDKRFFIAGGAWYGNDTIWRMIYDLNRILLYAPREGGTLAAVPQRRYLSILDGLVGGEGNGPLQPIPAETGLVAFADDPFLMDMAMASFMGFDWRKIPSLSNFRKFRGGEWGGFDPETVVVIFDGKAFHGIGALPEVRPYLPSPGWRGHIEREADRTVTVS